MTIDYTIFPRFPPQCLWKCLINFQFLQVSFFSTSPELSNKQRFEYFTRTIPSDHYQVKAMVDIVRRMGWSYISIIYEESNYGIKVRYEHLNSIYGVVTTHVHCLMYKLRKYFQNLFEFESIFFAKSIRSKIFDLLSVNYNFNRIVYNIALLCGGILILIAERLLQPCMPIGAIPYWISFEPRNSILFSYF